MRYFPVYRATRAGTFSAVTLSMKSSSTRTGVGKPQAPRHSNSINVNMPVGSVSPTLMPSFSWIVSIRRSAPFSAHERYHCRRSSRSAASPRRKSSLRSRRSPASVRERLQSSITKIALIAEGQYPRHSRYSDLAYFRTLCAPRLIIDGSPMAPRNDVENWIRFLIHHGRSHTRHSP